MPKDFVRENGRVKIIHRNHEFDYSEKTYEEAVSVTEASTCYSMESHLDVTLDLWKKECLRDNDDRLRIRDLNEKGRPKHPLA